MSLTPITKESMQQLKIKSEEAELIKKIKLEEAERIRKINMIIEEIYKESIKEATNTTNKFYGFDIVSFLCERVVNPNLHFGNRGTRCNPSHYNSDICNDKYLGYFVNENEKTIINELKILFPDCLISFNLCVRGQNRKWHNISKVDDKLLPFINNSNTITKCIVIDWS